MGRRRCRWRRKVRAWSGMEWVGVQQSSVWGDRGGIGPVVTPHLTPPTPLHTPPKTEPPATPDETIEAPHPNDQLAVVPKPLRGMVGSSLWEVLGAQAAASGAGAGGGSISMKQRSEVGVRTSLTGVSPNDVTGSHPATTPQTNHAHTHCHHHHHHHHSARPRSTRWRRAWGTSTRRLPSCARRCGRGTASGR